MSIPFEADLALSRIETATARITQAQERRTHHVFARRVDNGTYSWEGCCEECDFTTAGLFSDEKAALAECLRLHPQPPIVAFSHRYQERAPKEGDQS